MTRAPREPKTQQLPALRRLLATGVEVTTRIAIAPVFVDDAGRRRRLLTRFGYLAAAACVVYLVVALFSLTARPLGPLAGADRKLDDLAEATAPAAPAAPVSPAAPTLASSRAPVPTVAPARPEPVVNMTTGHPVPTAAPTSVAAVTSVPPASTVAPTSSAPPTTTSTTARGRWHGRGDR